VSRLFRSGCLIVSLLSSASFVRAADFVIRDGDTVAFLGDSITAAGQYGKIIENYTLLRFPERKVRFVNAGKGGDTAAGCLKRIDRDVFDRGATLVTVAFGINDIGWGMKADAEHKQEYLDGVRRIIERCKQHKVRVYICSAAVTAENPDTAETGFLQKMCDEGMALSRSLGEGAIDVQRTMRKCQRKVWEANKNAKSEKDKDTLHAGDGIHLNDYGQIAMAFAILKGLGAPADVSSAAIDARGPAVVEAKGCKADKLAGNDERLEFVRLDEGLPLNLGLIGLLSYRWVPIPDELNRYMLSVKNLKAGRYEIEVDGRSLGAFTSEQLAAGVNIASATPDAWEPGGPWDSQAALLRNFTDARNEVVMSNRLSDLYLTQSPNLESIKKQADDINRSIETLQRSTAKPTPYHFVIKAAPADVPKK
jgi:lysophospholipase L1-like esterase